MAAVGQQLRIAIVTPEYPPDNIGGGGVVVEALAHEYARAHDVGVFTARDGVRAWAARRSITRTRTLTVWSYPLVPVFTRRHYLRSVVPPNPVSAMALWTDLHRLAPDVAHLHGFGYATVDIAAVALSAKRIPYVFTIHGFPKTPATRTLALRTAYSAYRRVGADRTLENAREVTAVSASVANEAMGFRAPIVIPNGVTPLPSSDPYRLTQLCKRLGINGDAPVIAAAGRLARSKGFDILVAALRHLAIGPVTCVIAGADGGELSNLQQLAEAMPSRISVMLPGRLDRSELADLFEVAKVIVVPSRDEPFGLVGLEALAANRRVVASKVGGLAEFLPPPVADLVATDDPREWARCIAMALTRGSLTASEQLIAAAVVDEYSWRHIAARYLELMSLASKK